MNVIQIVIGKMYRKFLIQFIKDERFYFIKLHCMKPGINGVEKDRFENYLKGV